MQRQTHLPDQPHMNRLVHWEGTDEWRAEAAEIDLGTDGVAARGVQLGTDPLPYRLEYELDATEGWVTRTLAVETKGQGWERRLLLSRDSEGAWGIDTEARGDAALTGPGGPASELDGALDCDLGFSPLTNLMPIRREGLDRAPGSSDHLMAWVSVPDLEVFASAQRYEHVSASAEGSVVRFIDRGRFEGFTADLQLDEDGLARLYPGLARMLIH